MPTQTTRPEAISLKAFLHRLTAMQPLDIIPLLVLFILLFYGYNTWFAKIATMFLAITALLYRELLRDPRYWFAFACISGFSILYHWHPVDNHKFLLSYVTIMLFCAFSASPANQLRIISGNARLLIILLMGMSVFWKLYSSDPYLDGSFFEYTFIADERFDVFLGFFGLDMKQLASNHVAAFNLKQAYLDQDLSSIEVYSPPLLKTLAWLIGWWVVIIELVIAAFFMFRTPLMDKLGHWSLLLFIVTTYVPAPVYGFGWTLSVLGYAVSQTYWKNYGRLYLMCILLLIIYQIPWRMVMPIY
ncbi:hypothetical protein SAMN05216326_12210 [Nitrosomonas marina]|uniref:Uncharacterized protein n=1 Tax=Nitrosomonas marina TaxID=917 RepID=A0A1I0DRK5_9PROT|nr:hypothetical protein [Nitrosomonas marina]SET35027.1 hypothetical protein SAMN05216326_12210 [Nitrosomonas marina]